MTTLVLQADYNIAWLYYLRGDYAGPLRCCGRRAMPARPARSNIDYALCHMDLSEIYLELNLSEEAQRWRPRCGTF